MSETKSDWTLDEELPSTSQYTGSEAPPQCPACGTKLDGATSMTGKNVLPKAGALSVCGYCTAFLQYASPTKLEPLPADLADLTAEDLARLSKVAEYFAHPSHRPTPRAHQRPRFFAIPRGPEGFRAVVLFANNHLILSKPYPKLKLARRAAAKADGALLFEHGHVQDDNNGLYWIGVRFRLFEEMHVLPPIGPYLTVEGLEADQEERIKQVAREIGAHGMIRPGKVRS